MTSGHRTVCGVGAFVLALGLWVMQPANADDLGSVMTFLRSVLGTPSGYGNDYAENRALTRLDSERATLHARITANLNSGRLVPGVAQSLRRQLETNADLQAQYAADGLFTFPEAQSVWTGLNNLDGRLVASINSGGIIHRPGVNTTELDRLTARVATRLEQGRNDGRLAPAEYRPLRQQLDRIRADRSSMANSRGRLTWGEVQRLQDRLVGLNNQASAEIRDRQIAGRGSRYWY